MVKNVDNERRDYVTNPLKGYKKVKGGIATTPVSTWKPRPPNLLPKKMIEA
tara:strand:- start:174 stop:326 length:153 start_codon:yes stop_codon:yes gene_type:complete